MGSLVLITLSTVNKNLNFKLVHISLIQLKIIYTSTFFLSYANISLFIISRISIFQWSQDGWILATRDWWTEGYACLRDRERNTGSHRGKKRSRGRPPREKSWGSAGKGQGPGALVAVWLRHPRVSATGQGAEQRSATVGAVSFCWWGKEVYCLRRTKGTLPLCTGGLANQEALLSPSSSPTLQEGAGRQPSSLNLACTVQIITSSSISLLFRRQ